MKLTTFAIMLLGATVMTTGAWAKTAISTPSTMQQQHAQKSIAQIEALLKQKDIPFERVIASPYANMSGIYQVIYKDDVAYIDATGQYFIVGDVFEKNDLIKQAGGQLPAFEHQNTLPKSNLSYAKFSGELVYISPAQNYLWTGTLIRVDDMADLTDELTMEVNRVAWDSLPLQNAMKEVKGNGQRKMVVFS
ncbi:MAG: disulfide isomerase DsbC N-terminal domain-containing protein, partial [Acinetobacter sp.]|nr:disulfide isomerase DsbC N-terminal domain-containing protein [Acinetobacter sp.]